jgi:hypothetical protein
VYLALEFGPSLRSFARQRADPLAALEPLPREGWSRTATVTGAGKVLERNVLFYGRWLAVRIIEPSHTERIFSAQGCCLDPIADLNGTWFAVAFGPAQGIYLYANPAGVLKVSDIAGLPVGTLS